VAGPAWQRLASLSEAVLEGRPGELDADAFRNLALRYAVEAEGLALPRSVEAVLNRTYGMKDSALGSLFRNGVSVKLSKKSLGPGLAGHMAAAVLAAYGVTYRQALAEIEKMRVLSERDLKPWTQDRVNVRTVAEAKRTVERYVSGKLSNLRQNSPWTYWLLRLKAKAWLDAWLRRRPGKHGLEPAIPGIEEDRATISSMVSRPRSKAEARVRASIRDEVWMSSYTYRKRKSEPNLDQLVDQLTSARSAHFARSGRPIKWTWRVAGGRIGIARQTFRTRAQQDRRIEQLVPETSEAFFGRVVRWGVDECLRRGELVTLKAVSSYALLGWKRTEQATREIEQYLEETQRERGKPLGGKTRKSNPKRL